MLARARARNIFIRYAHLSKSISSATRQTYRPRFDLLSCRRALPCFTPIFILGRYAFSMHMTKHSCNRGVAGWLSLPPRVPRRVPQWSSAKRNTRRRALAQRTPGFVADTLMGGQSTRLGSERKQALESKTNSGQEKFSRRAPRGARWRPRHPASSLLSKTHAPQMHPCTADV